MATIDAADVAWAEQVAAEVAAAPDSAGQLVALRAAVATAGDPERVQRIVDAGRILGLLPPDTRSNTAVVKGYVAAELAGSLPKVFLFEAAEGGQVDEAGRPSLDVAAREQAWHDRSLHLEERTWALCVIDPSATGGMSDALPDDGLWRTTATPPPTRLGWKETASGMRKMVQVRGEPTGEAGWATDAWGLAALAHACQADEFVSWLDVQPSLVTGAGRAVVDASVMAEIAGYDAGRSGADVQALGIVRTYNYSLRGQSYMRIKIRYALPMRISDLDREDRDAAIARWNARLRADLQLPPLP